MNERKRQSINALAGAIAEAESKLYNEDSTDLNGLRALLNGFLNKDDSPGRVPASERVCGGTSHDGARGPA